MGVNRGWPDNLGGPESNHKKSRESNSCKPSHSNAGTANVN
jgi:hypothetical protein